MPERATGLLLFSYHPAGILPLAAVVAIFHLLVFTRGGFPSNISRKQAWVLPLIPNIKYRAQAEFSVPFRFPKPSLCPAQIQMIGLNVARNGA